MTRENGTHYRGLLAGFSPLAGVSAGTAGVLFLFGALCLAWHQVSGHVSLAITVVAYVVAFAVAVVACVGAWLAVLWVAHRHRHPELLVRRPASSFALSDEAVPQAIGRWEHHGPDQHSPIEHAYRIGPAAQPAAIEPSRAYFTDAQFAEVAEIMRHHADGEGR